jgi:hypothetical protein
MCIFVQKAITLFLLKALNKVTSKVGLGEHGFTPI